MPPPGFICVGVATTVTVSHSSAVQRQNVRHALLSPVDDIKNILPFQTTYTGNQSVQADMVVNLQGVPPRDMNREETELFERVMLSFVSERLRDDYDISGAEVISQSSGGIGSGGRSLMPDSAANHHYRGRSLQSSSAESLAVTVRVTGESRNPRKRQLEDKIEDVIDNDSIAFTEELTSAAKQDTVVSAYFERVEEVSAKPVDGEDSPPGPSPGVLSSSGGETRPNIGLIVGCVIGGIVAIAAAVLLYVKGAVGGSKKKKNQQTFERELRSFGSSQRFDGYESKSPPYSGNGGAGIKPAMYGNIQGYENTKLPMKMQTKKQIYGAPGTAAIKPKRAFVNYGEASMSRNQRMHGNDSTLDAKLAYNGAPTNNMPPVGRASARQNQSGPSRKFDAKLAYNGATVPQRSRQMPANGRSNIRDNLERKLAMNGGPIAGSVRAGNGQRSNSRPMRTAGDSVSSASGGNRMRRQGYHSSQGTRPSPGRGSRQPTHSLDSAPPRGGRTSRTSHGSQSSRMNESGLSSNSGGFRGEEDLHFR